MVSGRQSGFAMSSTRRSARTSNTRPPQVVHPRTHLDLWTKYPPQASGLLSSLYHCQHSLRSPENREIRRIFFPLVRTIQWLMKKGISTRTIFYSRTQLMSQCLMGSGCSKDQEIYDWITGDLISTLFINCHYDCTQIAQWITPNV